VGEPDPRVHRLREHPGLSTPWAQRDRPVPRVVVQPLQRFLDTEVASGVLLLIAALAALVWANSPWAGGYERLWGTEVTVGIGRYALTESLHLWVNDLGMALFFFVVGLEVKRELTLGRLSDPRAAALPVLCALGGMVVPAALYALVNAGGEGSSGWGVPMATDIAFAVGVLVLLGKRAPLGLRAFLLTLAVADDIGAIAVIAVFYSDDVRLSWLLVAALVIGLVILLERVHVRALAPYVLAAGVLWLAVFSSGIHATIAGVILGFLTPHRPFQNPDTVVREAAAHLEQLRARGEVGGGETRGVADEREQNGLLFVSELTTEAVSPLARLEEALHPWSSYLVLPLFALANAGVRLTGLTLGDPVTLGVILGLVIGKPLGITATAAAGLATRRVRLPDGVGWLELIGVGLLAGVGFTVAIFVAGLAFEPGSPQDDAAKVGILVASLLAGVIGSAFLAVRDASATYRVAEAPDEVTREAGSPRSAG
jgi:Na+:H+ antiporter, NhaA family